MLRLNMKGMIDSSFYGLYFLLWEVLPFMVGLSIYGIFYNFLAIGEYNIKILAKNFLPLFLLRCYNQVAKIVTLNFRLFCLLQKCLLWIELLKFFVKIVVCKLQNLTLHVRRRVVLLVDCIVKNVPISLPHHEMITYNCKICHAEFTGFYALRQHINTQHGGQIGFRVSKIDVEDIVGDVDDQSLREELEPCKHFLTDTEMENGRHRVFSFATLPSHPLKYLCSTINWNMYSKSWNVLQKLTLHSDSFWKILRMEFADTFMLTRTIRLWRSRNLCVHRTILPTWNRKYRKWRILIFVHEREPIPNGSFTNWPMWQFLQRYSKI